MRIDIEKREVEYLNIPKTIIGAFIAVLFLAVTFAFSPVNWFFNDIEPGKIFLGVIIALASVFVLYYYGRSNPFFLFIGLILLLGGGGIAYSGF